jgi:hypothetical protein
MAARIDDTLQVLRLFVASPYVTGNTNILLPTMWQYDNSKNDNKDHGISHEAQ